MPTTQDIDEPEGKVYCQYTRKARRHREGDRIWEDPETVEARDDLRKVTEEEKEVIRRDAEMEKQFEASEPTYTVDMLRAYNGLRQGDRAGFPKSKAEDLIAAGIASEDIVNIERPEDGVDAEDPEATEAARRKELEALDYLDLKSSASDVRDNVDGEPESQQGDDLVDFVLDHWQVYVSLEDE